MTGVQTCALPIFEFGKTDGHYWRKTSWNGETKVTYHYGKNEFNELDEITKNLRYYGSIVKEGRNKILPSVFLTPNAS